MHQVLDSLEKSTNSSSVKPFPLNAKYVPAVLAAKGKDGNDEKDESDEGDDGGKPKKPKSKVKSKKKKQAKVSKPTVSKQSDWQYGKIRTLFIETKKKAGLTYKAAAERWDESDEKAQILSLVSVSELKKRKFLEAGSTENPWLKKIQSSA